MVSTCNKPTRNYRAPQRIGVSESASGAMCHSIRHARRVVNSSAAQTNEGSGTADDASQRTPGDASQTTPIVEAPPIEPPKKRGRKPGSRTKFKHSTRGVKVLLKPEGDEQFEYVHYPAPYKYTTQLGAILRREYPGVLVEVDENGNEFQRLALDWADYFHENPGARGTTRGQKVLSEFWCLFQVAEGHEQHADRVLQECLKKRVRDMMYQVRVDAVKEYYNNIKHIQIKNAVARHIELEYEQYKQGQLEGFSDEVWLLLCAYWCSDEYKEKRKRGQISRSSNEDIAQNRGGSRPFTETRQVLEANFGPQKATHVNTFGAMKCGLKSLDSNGRCGPISSRKAQRRMDEYLTAIKRIECVNEEDRDNADMEVDGHEVEQQLSLNGKALYDVSRGSPRKHGRLAIANGAVNSSDIRAAGRERSIRPSNSVTMQNMSLEIEELRRTNGRLERENHDKENALQQSKIIVGLVLNLYQETGRVVPEEALRQLSAAQAIATGSSHAESANNTDGVWHNNGDPHATNVGNNQGSDNNGDHALM